MKKILLSIAIIISAATQAQTLMESTSVPAPWNPIYTIYQCDSTGVTPGTSGAGQTWNFASLTTHTNVAKTYVSSFNSNPSYPNAYTHVSASTSDDSYYTSSSNILKYYGGNLLINNIAVNLVYTSPAIMGKYPMSIGTSTTAAVGGSLTVSGSITGTFTGSDALNADATGTLVLPGKTFTDILRVVTSQTLNATLSFGTGNVTQLTYNYYSASASLVPILSIATSTLQSTLGGTSTQTLVTIYKDYVTASINDVQKTSIDLNVFPNPSYSFVNFNTTSLEATKIIAYDLTGKMVVTELVEFGKAKMNVQTLSNGLYLYTIIGKNNQVLITGKFNVSK